MSLASTTRNVLAAMLLAITAGCFTEPAESETGSPVCDPGSFGCECLAGVCEPDLECTPSNVCIPEDCTPGTAVCECDAQGLCGAMLECIGNVCRPPDGTTVGTETESTSVSSTSTSTSTSTTSSSTTESDESTTESVDSSTTQDPTGETSSSTTGEPVVCDSPDDTCHACFDCTHDADCSVPYDSCDAIPGCLVAAACMRDCAIDGLCFDNCCEGAAQSLVDAATALHTCREDACIGAACDSYANVLCTN